jgi:hypothetical protein
MSRFKDYKLKKKDKLAGSLLGGDFSPLINLSADAVPTIGALGGGVISQLSRDIDIGFDFVFHDKKYTKFRTSTSGYAQLVNQLNTPVVAEQIVPKPTSYYTFDDLDTTGNLIFDRLGGKNTALLTNITTGGSSTVMHGQIFAFDSSQPSTVDSFTDQFGYQREDRFSISFWISTTQDGDYIMGNRAGTGAGWFIEILSNVIKFSLSDDAGATISANSTTNVTSGQWYHVAITYSGNSSGTGIEIYVNGINVTDTQAGGVADVTTSATFVIGNDSGTVPTAGKYLDGSMDDVAFWSGTVLTAAQIKSIYDKANDNATPLAMAGAWAGRKTQTPSSYWPLYKATESIHCVDQPIKGYNQAIDIIDKKNGTIASGISTSTDSPLGSTLPGIDGSLSFDGSADAYIDAGSNYGFDPKTPFSISIWVKTSTAFSGISLPIIYRYGDDPDTATEYGWYLADAAAGLRFVIVDSAGNSVWRHESGVNINDGSWHHIVVTYSAANILTGGASLDPNDVTIYVDQFSTTTTLSTVGTIASTSVIANPAVNLYIGNNNLDIGGFATDILNGNIVEAAIWQNYSVTSDEVIAIYNQGSQDVPLAINPETEDRTQVLYNLGENSNLYTSNQILPGPVLAPWWNSTLLDSDNLSIKTWLDDSNGIGRRKRIINFNVYEWFDHNSTDGNLLTYQMILHENTSVVEFRYLTTTEFGTPSGASIGVASYGKNKFRNFSVDDYKNGGSIDTITTNLLVSSGDYPGDEADNIYIFKPEINTLLNKKQRRKTVSDLDAAFRHYPTPLRTGDGVRSQLQDSKFDDRNSIIFEASAATSYPTTLNDRYAAFVPLAASSIRPTGTSAETVKSATDNLQFLNFVEHTIPKTVEPFKEEHQFEQSKETNYYTTGSAVEDTGIGFQTALKSKKQIKIKLPINTVFNFLALTASINYYNASEKKFEIAGGPDSITQPGDVFGGMHDAKLFGPHGGLIVSGCLEELEVAGISSLGGADSIVRCIPLSTWNENINDVTQREKTLFASGALRGFYEKSVTINQNFNAASEQLIDTADFLHSPFLLEKAVIELPFKAGLGWFNDFTYCLFGSASNHLGETWKAMDIGGPCVTVSLLKQGGVSEGILASSPQGNVRRDVILSGTIIPSRDNDARISTFTDAASGDIQRDQNGFKSFSNPTVVLSQGPGSTFTGSVKLETYAATSNGILGFAEGTPETGVSDQIPATFDDAKIFQVNALGRAMDNEISGRSFFGKDFVLPTGSVGPTNGAVATTSNTFFWQNHAKSPYLLLPKDKLIFAISKHRPCRKSPPVTDTSNLPQPYYMGGLVNTHETFSGLEHDVGIPTGSIEITLYGSFIRAGKYNDASTLNQYLSSVSIHEAIGEDDIISDQFDVEKKELL